MHSDVIRFEKPSQPSSQPPSQQKSSSSSSSSLSCSIRWDRNKRKRSLNSIAFLASSLWIVLSHSTYISAFQHHHVHHVHYVYPPMQYGRVSSCRVSMSRTAAAAAAAATVTTSTTKSISLSNKSSSSSSSSSWRKSISGTWKIRFEELKEYKTQYGDCLVPKRYPLNPSLGEWVSQQRTMYKKFHDKDHNDNENDHNDNENNNNNNTQRIDRIQALNEIGFVWDVPKEKWSFRYNELKQYQSVYGDTLVASSYKENPALGKWVATQRRQYALLQQQKKNKKQSSQSNETCNVPLTTERIEALNKINFLWDMNSEGAISSSRWSKRFKELCQYQKENNGDTDVPLTYEANPPLGVWVHNQRLHYKMFMHAKTKTKHKQNKNHSSSISMLNEDRIQKLKGIGFVFEKNTQKWDQRYQELEMYKKNHGDCMVPDNYEENPSLASWVANQRNLYKGIQSGKTQSGNSSSLTAKRTQSLNDIGFCWSREEFKWQTMLEQIKAYHDKHGTFDIPSSQTKYASLRDWVKYQRNEYRKFRLLNELNDEEDTSNMGIKTTSMTVSRKEALENINFSWAGPRMRNRKNEIGPSADDWSLLFDKMKEKGIDANAKPKEHIFEGQDRFIDTDELQRNFDEDDLLSLWNEEDDDDDW